MSQKRIYQIAKELNISHVEIINFLKDKGMEVTNHMAPVDNNIYDSILMEFSKEKASIDRQRKERARKEIVSNKEDVLETKPDFTTQIVPDTNEEKKTDENSNEKQEEQEERKIQKEQKLKGEGKRPNGKVKWFNDAKGYGFIERKDEEKDIFVHFSAVKKSGLKSLEEGEQLTFEIENSDKGPSAINLQKVTNLEKAPVLKLVKKN